MILAQARTMDDFWDMLRGRGYEIRLNEKRKYVTIRHPNGERFIRLKSLGEDYTPRQLATRIATQRGNVVRNIEQIRMQQQKLGQRKSIIPCRTPQRPKSAKVTRLPCFILALFVYAGKGKKTKSAEKSTR